MSAQDVKPEAPITVMPSKVVRKSAVRQSAFVGLFVVGIAWFFYQLGDMFQEHDAEGWVYFSTPHAVGEMLKTATSGIMAIAGALGVNVRDLFAAKQEKP